MTALIAMIAATIAQAIFFFPVPRGFVSHGFVLRPVAPSSPLLFSFSIKEQGWLQAPAAAAAAVLRKAQFDFPDRRFRSKDFRRLLRPPPRPWGRQWQRHPDTSAAVAEAARCISGSSRGPSFKRASSARRVPAIPFSPEIPSSEAGTTRTTRSRDVRNLGSAVASTSSYASAGRPRADAGRGRGCGEGRFDGPPCPA
eukprot:CAMPEP_0183319688 /NCGR_PEP_ID=MMETSP0160_2-20130417/64349_1 /TAXON_ID=2839 ORGANISM="Odontella Sinensis, Strain Grunow 1884" /NCGR_SAMPLE_ID=MMETSP0160_2 /ASSEMBLY_ACC=CAM_ASM_000250 /LENGTH=197 /DNA_ID=CAMNT_0025486231 /DNA_START=92 /DNA_END=683 /DNA_ORIENTATION=-